MRRTAVIAAVLLGACVLAACQSQGVSSPTPQHCNPDCSVKVKTFPIVPAFHLTGDATNGKTIFTQNCGSCHTLAAAGTSGTVGPNLDTFVPKIDYRAATAQVTNGGGVMPAYGKDRTLSPQEIADVAKYVVISIGGTVPQ